MKRWGREGDAVLRVPTRQWLMLGWLVGWFLVIRMHEPDSWRGLGLGPIMSGLSQEQSSRSCKLDLFYLIADGMYYCHV